MPIVTPRKKKSTYGSASRSSGRCLPVEGYPMDGEGALQARRPDAAGSSDVPMLVQHTLLRRCIKSSARNSCTGPTLMP